MSIQDILISNTFEGEVHMLIGYARVSTQEQNEARQLEEFRKLGTEKNFIDKQSGKDIERPQLKAMLQFVREGDIVVVSEYSRLARNVQDLLKIIDELNARNVQLRSIKESLDTTTPHGKLMLTIFAGLAEFERDMIHQRQLEGIAIAKEQGLYKGRQPIPYDKELLMKECQEWRDGRQTARAAMQKLNMKPNRFYRIVKKLGL